MDRFIICARVQLITFDLRILVGKEYKPWGLGGSLFAKFGPIEEKCSLMMVVILLESLDIE